MSTARLLVGDVFDRMAELEDGSVDLILTSPPFLALRSYLPADHPDKGKEIGSEPTPAAFLDTLLALTAEWRRLLAPHGSICVELGDTYSGSGGDNHLYEGSNPAGGFNGSADHGALPGRKRDTSRGWPMAKSLCGIPHLYHLSLAYGRNLLTGAESPAGSWRVRNVVAWCRPNPPVGALGDKFRPGTSYMTVACVSGSRYFDLDAVRTPPVHGFDWAPGSTKGHGIEQFPRGGGDASRDTHSHSTNPAGAPPLDWWEIPTQPYAGAHYATWPAALCERPIKAMCPMRVCTVCGQPSRRIVDVEGLSGRDFLGAGNDRTVGLQGSRPSMPEITRTTTGWSDCGCTVTPTTYSGDEEPQTLAGISHSVSQRRRPARAANPAAGEVDPIEAATAAPSPAAGGGSRWRTGLVLDPFAGSGTTLAVATGHGRDAIGIDLDARNAELCAERVGMFLEVDGGRPAGVA